MRVGEIVKPYNFAIFRRLLDAKLWNRDAEDFSDIDLDCLFSLVSRFESRKTAQRACDIVVLKLKAAQISGDVDYVRVEQKQFLKPLISQQQFDDNVAKLPQARQDCIKLALEMQWPLDAAIALERSDVKHYLPEMNERAVDIVNRQPASLFKKTVFWEMVGKEARMLISLRHQFIQTFNQPWDSFMRQYDTTRGCFSAEVTKEQALSAILQRS